MATQRVWLRNKFLRRTREFPIRDASLLLADEFPAQLLIKSGNLCPLIAVPYLSRNVIFSCG